MNRDEQQQFVSNVRQRLDQSLAELDEVTLARLRAARRTALQTAQADPGRWRRHWLLPATAVLTLLLVSVWWVPKPGVGGLPLEDLPLLTASDDFELYRDLDFYQWLEQQREQG